MTATQAAAKRETIELGSFLRALLAEFEASARARHVTLDALVFLAEISANPHLLRGLLLGLLGEALRRAPTGTNVTVVVSPRERQAEFWIAAEGAGMSRETRDQAFQAAGACGAQLSVTETDDRTVVCIALPWEARGVRASQLAVHAETKPGVAQARRERVCHESGIYPTSQRTGVHIDRQCSRAIRRYP